MGLWYTPYLDGLLKQNTKEISIVLKLGLRLKKASRPLFISLIINVEHIGVEPITSTLPA